MSLVQCGWYLAAPGDCIKSNPQASEPLIRRLCRNRDEQELPAAQSFGREKETKGGRG